MHLTAAEMLGNMPAPRRWGGVIVLGAASGTAVPMERRRSGPPSQRKKARQLVCATLCDGRVRPLAQIAEGAGLAESTVSDHLAQLAVLGEVEITIIAGRWMYGITNFGG